MVDSGGRAGTQLRAMTSGKAKCFDSAGGVPCGDKSAPPHGEYLSGQLPAAKRHVTHPVSYTHLDVYKRQLLPRKQNGSRLLEFYWIMQSRLHRKERCV